MKKFSPFIVFLFIIFTTGCGNSTTEQIACAQDSDCWNSCQYGAINKNWYKTDLRRISGECLDGCASVVAAEPKCENKKCVAYIRNPSTQELIKNNDCTNVKIK